MKRIWMVIALMAAASMAAADEDPMKALAVLVGEWEGPGTMRLRDGTVAKTIGDEKVESRLDGRVILVEGRHWDADRTRVVHHAFGMFTWDEEKKEYRFRTQLANGRGGDFRAFLEEGSIVWEMTTPGGRTRYYITIKDDTWTEVGKIERGGTWTQFFEMVLKKK